MDKKYTLGIIGAGNMATAILKGIISGNIINPSKIIISDVDIDKLNSIRELGVNVNTDNNEIISSSEFILFAVKPQIFSSLQPYVSKIQLEQKAISIMAGISIDSICEIAGKSIPVCRVMPNTPCMIGQGMSALCYKDFRQEEKSFVNGIFSAIGDIVELDESLFDAVTSVSGSGPAYVYYFIDALIKGGIEGGLTPEISRKLAIKTVIGATEMVRINADKPINELIDAVCSKGGTTIEAINTFRDNRMDGIIIKGVRACRLRSKELSGK